MSYETFCTEKILMQVESKLYYTVNDDCILYAAESYGCCAGNVRGNCNLLKLLVATYMGCPVQMSMNIIFVWDTMFIMQEKVFLLA